MKINTYLSSFDLDVLKEYKKAFPNSELNVLISYGTVTSDYYDMMVTYRDKISSLILDSGAFTYNFASSSVREKIDLDGFKNYCLEFQSQFDFIFNFDSNFTETGYIENCRNQKILEDAGIRNLVPVVHDYTGKYTDEVGEFIKNYDIISLGSSPFKGDKDVVNGIVYRIKDAGKKIHLLGVSSYGRIKDLPIDYNDSSNWAQAQKFGYIYYWNSKTPNNPEVMLRFNDHEQKNENNQLIYFEDYEYRDDVEDYLKNSLNIRYIDLYGHYSTLNRQIINTHYFVKLQDHVREAHQKNGFNEKYP